MMNKKFTIILSFVLLIASSTLAKSTEECFEGISRSIFKFNMAFDDIVLEPIAKGYNKLPVPLKKGTNNFTSNIATLLSIPNSFLQGDLKQVGHATGSFLINSTVGVLGILNPAEKMGLKPYKEDVGQTLGSYGIGPGCYFVLPILGPTTARDTIAMVGDTFLDPFATMTWRQKEVLNNTGKKMDYIAVKGTAVVDFRADNDKNFESLKKNSLDLYSATKSLYLQNKKRKILNSKETQDEDWGNLDN